MAEQEQNRSEEPTPHRLQEARRRGNVAKSLEMSSLFAMAAGLMLLYGGGWDTVSTQLRASARLLASGVPSDFTPESVSLWLGAVLSETAATAAPLFGVLMIVAILGTLVQTGPVFSLHPIRPDPKRLHPGEGLKRIFSKRTVFELFKNLVKIALFAWTFFLLLEFAVPELLSLVQSEPRGLARRGFDTWLAFAAKLLVVLAAIALVDLVFVRWSHHEKLKMSRREIREETKQHEGDPRIRARLRELRREMLKRARAIRSLPDADVLITNPTHVAVALRYRRDEMAAPTLIAKGSGEHVPMMKAIARRHRVPVIQSPLLARMLFAQVDIDAPVPEALYPKVARVLVWAYSVRAPRAEGARP